MSSRLIFFRAALWIATLAPAPWAAADEGLADLCSDRPTKSTYPCTVDIDRWQIESGFIDYSGQIDAGMKTDTLEIAGTTAKLGVASDGDVEFSFTPYENVQQISPKGHDTVSGFGDLYFRYKRAIIQDSDSTVGFALEPYIKIPTASPGLGDGAVEVGAVAPVTLALPLGLSLTTDPEIDILKDKGGSGYHPGVTNLINLGRQITPEISGAVEFWTVEDLDPAAGTRQTSFDFGLAWLTRRELQFDVGVNFGMNAATPRLQIYNGISFKY
ncbi:MAG: transporter [Rhizomicrobium sp.]|jgi:hypothetical protein